MNKIVSVFLTLAVLLAFALPATASAADNASIVVEGPDSLTLKADDFKAYQLFTVTTSVSGGKVSYAYLPVQPAVDNFLAWAKAKYGTDATYGANATAFKQILQDNEDNEAWLTTLTSDLTDSGKFVAVGTTTVATVNDTSGTGVHSEVTIGGLNYGYYLVTGQGSAPGENGDVTVTSHSMLVTLDKDEQPCRIDLKADAPSVTKKVWNDDTKTWGEWTDVNIGDTVDFQLVSVVPNMTGYRSYTYIAHDTLDPGLSLASGFSKADVKVEIGGVAFDDFTVSKSTDNQSLTVTFGPSFRQQTVGASIVISYSATLNEDAQIAPDSNNNEAWLEYSNNPYHTGEGGTTNKTPHSRVRVFTYDVKVHKVDGDDTSIGLAGAVFNLRTVAGDATSAIQFKLTDAGSATAPAQYVVVKSGGSVDATSPASGLIRFVGLDAGTYYLFEKQAPDGYNIMDAETELTIKPAVTKSKGCIDQVSYSTPEPFVKNFKGSILPHTGGMGTVIFYVVGVILTVGLIGFFIIRRRRNLLSVK